MHVLGTTSLHGFVTLVYSGWYTGEFLGRSCTSAGCPLCGATKEEASTLLSIFVRVRMVVSAWTLEGDGVLGRDHLFALLRQDGRDVCLGVQQRVISTEDRSAARQVGTRARLQALPLTEDVRNLVDKARINLQSG